MDGVSLLAEARAAGLSVHLDGDRLVIRGPRSAEPVARRLLAAKPAVVAAIQGVPAQRCWWCKGSRWWLSVYGRVICGECHPPAPGALQRWLSPSKN